MILLLSSKNTNPCIKPVSKDLDTLPKSWNNSNFLPEFNMTQVGEDSVDMSRYCCTGRPTVQSLFYDMFMEVNILLLRTKC